MKPSKKQVEKAKSISKWLQSSDYEEDEKGKPISLVVKIAQALADEREKTLEEAILISDNKISYQMSIPCPDGVPGCAVSHSVNATRWKQGTEISAELKLLIKGEK